MDLLPLSPRPNTTRWLAALVVSLAPVALPASTVRELNLLALEHAAGSIFHGRCLAVKEVHAGTPVPYTEYRFRVLSAVKGCRDQSGDPLKTITFRHLGTRRTFVRPDGTRALPLRLGIPTYRAGEEVVLFLTRESGIGLCVPVGLTQGKFSVVRKDGAVRVRNAVANAGLFKSVEARAFEPEAEPLFLESRQRPARLDLDGLLELCRRVKR